MHDLLQDSWRRAHAFARQYQQLLINHHQQGLSKQSGVANGVGGNTAAGAAGSSNGMPAWLAAQQFGAAGREVEEAISLQPLVEELCSSTTGTQHGKPGLVILHNTVTLPSC